MRRTTSYRILGALLVLHGLAHTLAGMRATADFAWLPAVAWAMAVSGFVAAGAGLLGASTFRPHWRRLAAVGVGGSALLLLLDWRGPLAVPGLLADLAVVALLVRVRFPASRVVVPRHRIANGLAVFAVAILTALVLLRPWHMRWGSTNRELRAYLPGDELVSDATYVVQHAVTIPAPPTAVWPWLVQVGQDRGGFYSYAWLENLFGLGIRNADRIHPEWQDVAVGDSIYATPAGWLGFDRRFGWRVARAEPGTVLVLEQWGAFVLLPTTDGGTRLIVRTRGGGTDRLRDVVLAPFGFLLFEPAHFLMERKMLLEVKRLATEHR
jgi:hypothetical protein